MRLWLQQEGAAWGGAPCAPAPWGSTAVWGRGRHRGGSIPPSKIRKKHTFPVLDTLQCGCTHLWGLHLSPRGAPVSGDCTQLWELHLFLRVCPSPGMHVPWAAVLIPWDTAVFRACTRLLGCAYLRGLHPSLGAISQDASIFPEVHPSPGATTIFWCASIFRVCTHLSGCNPQGGGCSPLLLGTHLRVLECLSCSAGLSRDAQAAQLVPGGVPVSLPAVPSAHWVAARTWCCCPCVPAAGCSMLWYGHWLPTPTPTVELLA